MHWRKSPAANICGDFAASLAVVSELADPALRLAWLSPSEKAQIALGIGLAGPFVRKRSPALHQWATG